MPARSWGLPRASSRLEIGGEAVDAIAQMRRRRAILEDMAEMRTAARAMHLGARHAPAAVDGRRHRARHRIVEARPTGAAVELPGRFEQRLAAARAGKDAGALFIVERATAGALGAVLARDRILLGGEQRAPFGLRMRHGKGFLFHRVRLRRRAVYQARLM